MVTRDVNVRSEVDGDSAAILGRSFPYFPIVGTELRDYFVENVTKRYARRVDRNWIVVDRGPSNGHDVISEVAWFCFIQSKMSESVRSSFETCPQFKWSAVN